MEKKDRDQLAKIVVEKIRNFAIDSCNSQVKAHNLNSSTAKRWKDAKDEGKIDFLMEMVITDSIDIAIFYLFQAIDDGTLNLSFNLPDGKSVNLTKEGLGELAGWYLGEWRQEYSKKPIFDY